MLTLLWTRWCVIWIIGFYRWRERDNKLFHYVVVTDMVVDAVIAYLLDILEDWWAIPHLIIKSTTLTIWVFERNLFLFRNRIQLIGIRLPNMCCIQWRGFLFGLMISSNSSIYGNRMRGMMWLFSSTFHFAFPEKKGLDFFHFTSTLFLHIRFFYFLINLPVSISPIYAFSIQ